MSIYNNIVVAIDPFVDSNDIVKKANQMLNPNGKIELIYVDEQVPIAFMGAPLAPPMIDYPFEKERKSDIKLSLEKLAKQYSIPEKNVHILTGSPAKEIRVFAKKVKADCIVIGTHGRHGVALLLGSTASSVIHGTPCDILAVKIIENK